MNFIYIREKKSALEVNVIEKKIIFILKNSPFLM